MREWPPSPRHQQTGSGGNPDPDPGTQTGGRSGRMRGLRGELCATRLACLSHECNTDCNVYQNILRPPEVKPGFTVLFELQQNTRHCRARPDLADQIPGGGAAVLSTEATQHFTLARSSFVHRRQPTLGIEREQSHKLSYSRSRGVHF